MEIRKIIRHIIRENISFLFDENVQLADKVYFNSGKIPKEIKDIIVSKITNGDNFTKIITDIYWAYLQQQTKGGKWAVSIIDNSDYEYPEGDEAVQNFMLSLEKWKEIKQLYFDLKDYNKNVFPIKGLDIYKPNDIWNIISGLKQRRQIIDIFKKLPSIAWRNMKSDINQERDYPSLQNYRHDLEYFLAHYSLLGNRGEHLQQKILQKMFKSNTNLEQLLRFAEEKENLLGGAEFTKEQIKQMAQEEDFEVIYEQGDVMIVRVDSPDGIKKIGCNSLWCFTYGSGFDDAYRQWNNYSHNDMVYVIIDFKEKSDSEDFMHVLIRPLIDENGRFLRFKEDDDDQHPLFNMANENWQNPYYILETLFGKNYKQIVKKYMDFEY
jgi:hypothetical protein